MSPAHENREKKEEKNSGYHTFSPLTSHPSNAYIHRNNPTNTSCFHQINSIIPLLSTLGWYSLTDRDPNENLIHFPSYTPTWLLCGPFDVTPRASVTARTPFDSAWPIIWPAAISFSSRPVPCLGSSAAPWCRPTTSQAQPRPQS